VRDRKERERRRERHKTEKESGRKIEGTKMKEKKNRTGSKRLFPSIIASLCPAVACLESDGVTDFLPQPATDLLGDALRHGHGGDTAWLRAANAALRGVAAVSVGERESVCVCVGGGEYKIEDKKIMI